MSKILTGDCIESMRGLPEKSVNCCVTSPPYFGLRSYDESAVRIDPALGGEKLSWLLEELRKRGIRAEYRREKIPEDLQKYFVRAEIGLEKTPEEFVAKLVEVFREVRRVLRDDGTVFLNLGDSYASSPTGNVGTKISLGGGRDNQSAAASRPNKAGLGLAQKQLIGIPWRVAFALQADGWCLRQDIIWHKPNPMPESVRDRCTKAHEYIFMLSKSPKYYYDHAAMQEPCVKGAAGSEFHTGKTGEHQLGRASTKPRKNEGLGKRTVTGFQDRWDSAHGETRNRRDVWTVASQPFKGAHFATFPPALIEPCVLAGCPVGGTVLDPFGGAGTTGLVATRHGREYVLCELNPEYSAMAEARILKEKK